LKVIIGTIVMLIFATLLISRMIESNHESLATVDVFVDNHFSQIQHKNYHETYENFHEDLQQSISLKEYEAAWKKRIEEIGPLQSWEIHTSNKSYNLFTNETEYNVIIRLSFGSDKVLVAAVRHDWKVEEETMKLIWTGSARGYLEAY
jgi:hypothetical protein